MMTVTSTGAAPASGAPAGAASWLALSKHQACDAGGSAVCDATRKSRPTQRVVSAPVLAALTRPSSQAQAPSLGGPYEFVPMPPTRHPKTIEFLKPGEDLAALLHRKLNGPGLRCAYPAGRKAFADAVKKSNAKMLAAEATAKPCAPGALGLHPQFLKDFRRSTWYVFPYGRSTCSEDVLVFDRCLREPWDDAQCDNHNLENAYATPVSHWLDVVCPISEGLLRLDVTGEASQAAFAAAMQVISTSGAPEETVTPYRGGQSEFFVWPENQENRVHIVALTRFDDVLTDGADDRFEQVNQGEQQPCLLAVHLSVGMRQDKQKNVAVQDAQWLYTSPDPWKVTKWLRRVIEALHLQSK